MRTRVLLVALALGVPVVLASGAHAQPCTELTGVPPYGLHAVACLDEGGCAVYQTSTSQIHIQQEVCLP